MNFFEKADVFIQRLYLLPLNFVGKNTCRADKRTRLWLVFVCFAIANGIIIYTFVQPWSGAVTRSLSGQQLACAGLVLLAAVFGIDGELKPVKWDRKLFFMILLAAFAMAGISFLHPVGAGYRALCLTLAVSYPCFWLVWNSSEDRNEVLAMLCLASVVACIAYYIYCILLAVHGELMVGYYGRVNANARNANLVSMIGMASAVCAPYMLTIHKSSKSWFAFAFMGMACGWGLVFMGGSRASVIVVAGAVLCFFIFQLKQGRYTAGTHAQREMAGKMMLLAAAAVIAVSLNPYIIQMNAEAAARNAAEPAPVSVHMDCAGSSGADLLAAFSMQAMPGESALERFDIEEGESADYFMSGRLSIWKGYAAKLNMLGNDTGKADWVSINGGHVAHAHNNFLEYAFRFGIPVGILHILIELYAGVLSLVVLFGRRYRDPAYLFAAICMLMYAVESMLDIATLSIERHAPFFFYIALLPLMVRRTDDDLQ